MAIKSVMSETASIYVHLDYHIAHYVKILMDEIFGENNYKNEIIWCYRGMAIATEHYTRRHDNIFFYTKNEEHCFALNVFKSPKSPFKYFLTKILDSLS